MEEIQCDQLFLFFGRITVATMIIPVIVAIMRRNHFNKALKVFFYFCLITFIINSFEQTFIWAANNIAWVGDIAIKLGGNTSFLLIFYHLRDFAFLGWFYSILLPSKYGLWVRRIAIFLSVTAIINYLFIEEFKAPGVFNPTADAIFASVLPLFYLWRLYSSGLSFPLSKNAYFWFSIGVIVPNLVGLFLYFAGDAIYAGEYCLFVYGSIIKNGFEIIGQVLLAIGFWNAIYVKYIPLQK